MVMRTKFPDADTIIICLTEINDEPHYQFITISAPDQIFFH
jgi:hypothetical protein